jgi:hypothetical protein
LLIWLVMKCILHRARGCEQHSGGEEQALKDSPQRGAAASTSTAERGHGDLPRPVVRTRKFSHFWQIARMHGSTGRSGYPSVSSCRSRAPAWGTDSRCSFGDGRVAAATGRSRGGPGRPTPAGADTPTSGLNLDTAADAAWVRGGQPPHSSRRAGARSTPSPPPTRSGLGAAGGLD